jgi:hypothetical protein
VLIGGSTLCFPKTVIAFRKRARPDTPDVRFGVFAYLENEVFDDPIMRAYRGLLKKRIKRQLSDLLRHYFIAKAEFDGDFGFGFWKSNGH